MEIKADARLPFPTAAVFTTYRDRMPELVKWLPNVLEIKVKSRTDEGPVSRLVNVWKGGGEIPASARAFVNESMLSWDDHAVWNETELRCEWKIVTHAFTEAVNCKGTTRFVPDGDGARIEIRGKLEIDATKVKGVPRLLAGTVGRAVEEVLGRKIGPNLVDVTEGVRKYLEQQKSA